MKSNKIFICIKGNPRPELGMDHDSHAVLIKRLGLRDDRLYDREFVRVAMWPRCCWFDPMIRFGGWEFSVDEEKTLPAWFENDRDLWLDRCLDEMEGSILPQLSQGIFPGDFSINEDLKTERLERITGCLYVNGSATLNAPNLKHVGGRVAISPNAKLISSLGGELWGKLSSKIVEGGEK